jgi:putative spermidine/putrescine transport system ATP-binding protein
MRNKVSSVRGASVRVSLLSKSFGSYRAVDNLSLDIESGSFVSILGPSGCGKTTTLMMLAGFTSPTSGKIFVDESDITELPANRRNLGMVFQSYALFPHMTVFDNVAFPLKMRKVPKQEAFERVQDALEMVHLTEMAHRLPSQLSGGQQQRVALARTIVFRPSVLLMDEPLSALDRKLRDRMRFEIKHLQEKLGATVVYVTHDQSEAFAMSDKVIVMREGKLEQMGSPTEIYHTPATRFVAELVGETNFLSAQIDEISNAFCVVSVKDKLKLRAKLTSGFNDASALKTGQLVTASVRPECIRMSTAGSQENSFEVQVLDRTFLGEIIRYTLALPSGDSVVAKHLTRSDLRPVSPGETLTASVAPSDVRVLLS